jgi:alkanesulfonate monooxygenase SsuD/methylene tetrahydromethanopterin reductase-like flavin-dependent oxidoreductase (luciferase family)
MTPEQREAFIQQRREGFGRHGHCIGAVIVMINVMTVHRKRRKQSE